jgi:small conductance mechanosensitive channel
MRPLLIAALIAVCLGWTMAWPQTSFSQVPGLPQLAGADPALPGGVTRHGQVETTNVYLDGRALFEVASPTVPDRAQPGALVPVEYRAREIEARLQRLMSSDSEKGAGKDGSTKFAPETLGVRIEMRGGQPVLLASDASNAEAEELLAVTQTDAQYQGVTATALAERWRETLEQELRTALQSRQPEATKFRLLKLAGILFSAFLASYLLGKVSTTLARRKKALAEQRLRAQQAAAARAASSQAATAKASATREAAPDPDAPKYERRQSERLAAAAQREEQREKTLLSHILGVQFGLARRHQAVRLLLWLASWAIVFIWVAAIAGIFYQFPQTRGVADRIVSIPALILGASFAAGLANGLVGLFIDRIMNAWSRSDEPRRSLRVPTVAAALKGLAGGVLYTIAVIGVLEYVLVIPFTVVALGAVAAVAVSFAAQNLVKDFVNGLLILVEDQYALGDEVQIGDAGGVVERLNLRLTQLRAADGRLITIPNHEVNRVENKTRLWSRVDFRVAVACETDVDKALAMLSDVANEMANEPMWRPLILEAPQVLGVEDISHAGIVLRLLIQTLPFKREDVARELRRRVKIAVDREDIGFGMPQQAMMIEAARDAANERLPKPGGRDRTEGQRRLQA